MALTMQGQLPLTAKAMEYVFQESMATLRNGQRDTEDIRQELKELKDKAEVIAFKMLDHFKVEGETVEAREKDLQKILQSLRDTTKSMNGQDYWAHFGRYLAAAEPYTGDRDTIQTVYEHVLEGIQMWMSMSNTQTTLQQELYDTMKEVVKNDLPAKDISKYTGRNFKFSDWFADLTPLMRDRFRKAYERGYFNDILENVQPTNKGVNFIVTKTNLFDLLRLTPEKAKNLFVSYPNLYGQVKDKLRECILDITNAEFPDLLNKAINQVFSSDEAINAIFVGARSGGYLGILGEIQALYYTYVLLKDPKNSPVWSGGKKFNGMDPHADLVLETLDGVFGTQVKNVSANHVMEDGSRSWNIDFKSFSTQMNNFQQVGEGIWDSFFTDKAATAAQQLGIPPDVLSSIWQLVTMRSFNIPYLWDPTTGEAVATDLGQIPLVSEGAETYVETRNALMGDQVDDLMARVMIQYVVGLLYLQTGLDQVQTDNPEANTLFIIAGGQRVYTAYSILKSLIDELDGQLKRLNFSSTYTRSSDKVDPRMGTIIEVINSPTGSGIKGQFALQTSFLFT